MTGTARTRTCEVGANEQLMLHIATLHTIHLPPARAISGACIPQSAVQSMEKGRRLPPFKGSYRASPLGPSPSLSTVLHVRAEEILGVGAIIPW
jgi:hypothetical protein